MIRIFNLESKYSSVGILSIFRFFYILSIFLLYTTCRVWFLPYIRHTPCSIIGTPSVNKVSVMQTIL